jgi:hypothetical protein
MIHLFTSATLNYLPKVRLLCQSVKKHHPDWTLHFALADKMPDWFNCENEPFDNIINVNDLDIPNLTSWAFFHNIVEFSTAIKPFALQHLLNQKKCSAVLYLDPDIVTFSPLNDLIRELDKANILLTPHLTKQEEEMDAILDNELCTLKHGIYNLGFIAVKPTSEGQKFAQWWADRVYHFCIGDWKQGLFTDQRWIDLVPAFFDGVTILKSSRFNVAPWNLSKRQVSGNFLDGFKVDGKDLGFYHFTGFDSGAHKMMSQKYAPNNAAVESLINWYETDIMTNKLTDQKYRWSLNTYDNGVVIEAVHRKIYRSRLDLQNKFLNPFCTKEKENYYLWIKTQGSKEHPELLAIQ